jgi:hypothetical protein
LLGASEIAALADDHHHPGDARERVVYVTEPLIDLSKQSFVEGDSAVTLVGGQLRDTTVPIRCAEG